MALTDEHWKCIRERAFPVMARKMRDAKIADMEAKKAELDLKQAAFIDARSKFESAPDEAGQAAVIAAQDAVKSQASVVDLARHEVEKAGTIEGAIDCMQDCWEVLSDGDNLDAWCEKEEVAILEADQARALEVLQAEMKMTAERKKALK